MSDFKNSVFLDSSYREYTYLEQYMTEVDISKSSRRAKLAVYIPPYYYDFAPYRASMAV